MNISAVLVLVIGDSFGGSGRRGAVRAAGSAVDQHRPYRHVPPLRCRGAALPVHQVWP